MITIYCDFYQLREVEANRDMVVVSNIQDYIPLRQRLRCVLDQESGDYAIYVRHPILAQWLTDLRDYGEHIVKWVEVDLQNSFEQRFGFLPQKELGEAAIRDLYRTLPPTNGNTIADPVGWILCQCVNPIWQNDKPGQEHLVDLAAWILKMQNIPDLFLPLMRSRLTQWAEYNSCYRIFLEHPWMDAAKSIFTCWIFRYYPKSFIESLKMPHCTSLQDCSRYPLICVELVKEYQTALRRFWGEWFVLSPAQEIQAALQWMSGLADAELDAVDKWARNHQQDLTDELLRVVKERFSLHSRATSVLERLEKLVPPPLPSNPDPTWSPEQWLGWVAEEYLPYFAWVIRNNQSRDIQIDKARQFEAWLIDIYSKLTLDPKAPFAPSQLGRIKELFDTNSVDTILWFIVDGMTWWQGKKLVDFCVERGIKGIFMRPTISALPTITPISKKALVHGYLDASDTTLPIAQILRERFAREGKPVQVYTHYHTLERAFTSDLQPGLYTLLYGSLDHHCHEEQGFTDNESIDGHLRLIARLVEDGFNCCLRSGLRVKAFVSSDHGSTLLPESTRVLDVPNLAHVWEEEGLPEEYPQGNVEQGFRRIRVCATDKIPSKHDLDMLEQDWYYLQKDTFYLPKQFFIPKGYSAIERRPRGWTHGGATPEEVVVSSIEMQPSQIDFVEPVVTLTGSLQLRKEGELTITVENANVFPIKVVKLRVADSVVETRWYSVGPNASFTKNVHIQAVHIQAVHSREKTYTVNWFLICEGGGQRKEFTGRVDVPIRRMQVSDLDEIFEDML